MNIVLNISAPSGTGKSTIIKKILEKNNNFALSISFTTRYQRSTELNGREYNFISRDEFQKKIEDGDFLEYEEIFGNLYGTCKISLKKIINANKNAICDLTNGGVKNIINSGEFDNILSIFLLPPSMIELKNRLLMRNSEKIDIINSRISQAKNQIKDYGLCDYVIINDHLETALREINMLIAYKLFTIQNKDLIENKINKLINENI